MMRMKKENMPLFKVDLGDILRANWSEADFIVANSTCFSEDLMQGMAEAASKCKKGSWFVTLTKRLPTSDVKYGEDKKEWNCELSIKLKMSWGLATINVHRKIKDA